MTITYVPRGIHSVRENEPKHVIDESGSVTEEQFLRMMKVSTGKPDLAYEIRKVLGTTSSKSLLADKILAIPRIRDAIKLMDDIDSGAVELITYGSKPESSDAR